MHSKDLHKIIISLQKTAHNHNARVIDQVLSHAITNGLTTHSTSTWNCILRAYSKSPTPIKALRIFNQFSPSIYPDNYTYPPLLKACSSLFSLSMGTGLHARLTKTGLDADIYVQNALLQFYGVVVADLTYAHVLFDRMPYRDIASWNTFLGIYNNNPDFGIQNLLILFKRLMCEEIKADKITFVILLSACAREEEIDCGRALHSFVTKVGLECNLNLENALLEMYTKCGDMDAALTLFNQMVSMRDLVSYTILINGYVEMGSVDLARQIFDNILIKDSVLWGSMIHAYVKAKQPKAALELFKKMVDDGVMIPDENIMVSVISACASLSDLQFGRLVHQFIFQNNISQDAFVKTALIDMYSKCGSLEEALVTFYKMDDKDVFAWTTMIEGLAKSGIGDKALRLFNQMERQGVTPNEATFVSVLAACSHSGLITEGCQLFTRIATVYRVKPKMEHFGCIIDLLSRAGLLYQAEEFIKSIPSKDKLIAYKTLLSACIKYSEFNLGKKVANEIMNLGSQSNATFILLSNFYALTGQWDEVTEVRRNMKRFDARKKPGTSAL
ncbi:hypothetical protein EZV62_027459 [Acer yangbiense]|uniref:Pentacotripeptide-repeat region of PRORP domain-containing protein n=1 Tax=Acer yangbiense TaxID=1000413 RepID=A0A5C7GUE9_9ROSI|nr:hypothetical protein EZV62_027459 [Acer yangbiense]